MHSVDDDGDDDDAGWGCAVELSHDALCEELSHDALCEERESSFIDNLLVRIHLIIVMISVDRPCAIGV